MPLAQASVDEIGEKLVNDFLTDVITMQGRFEQSLIDAEGAVSRGLQRHARDRATQAVSLDLFRSLRAVAGRRRPEYLELRRRSRTGHGQAAGKGAEQYAGAVAGWCQGCTRAIPLRRQHGGRRYDLGSHAAIDDGQWLQSRRAGVPGRSASRMVFFDNLEQTTLVALYDVVVNEPIDADHFEFVVPD